MVSFNCDACGDVVKKPKLDQHASRCQASVTCLDCSTTFNSPAQWKTHTTCISEAQKYEKTVWKGDAKKEKKTAASAAPAAPSAAAAIEPSSNGTATSTDKGRKSKDTKNGAAKEDKQASKKLKDDEKKAKAAAKQAAKAEKARTAGDMMNVDARESSAAVGAKEKDNEKCRKAKKESTLSGDVAPAAESKKRKQPSSASPEELKAAKKAKRKAKAHAGAAADLEASVAADPYGLPAVHAAMAVLLPEEALDAAGSKARTSSAVSLHDIAKQVAERNDVSEEKALLELARAVKVSWRTSARGARAPLVLR